MHVVRPIYLKSEYILLFLKGPNFIETGIPRMTGVADQKRIPSDYFAFSPFPLPPLAEQERIVSEVDKLMQLLNDLEAGIMSLHTMRHNLMDSLIIEALESI